MTTLSQSDYDTITIPRFRIYVELDGEVADVRLDGRAEIYVNDGEAAFCIFRDVRESPAAQVSP